MLQTIAEIYSQFFFSPSKLNQNQHTICSN
jgi:hypothetical protein